MLAWSGLWHKLALSLEAFSKVICICVFFRGGAHFRHADNNLLGYKPERVHRSDLYPLVCKIVSGDVTKQLEVEVVANVHDSLETNAHLHGVPADVS